jgi:FtsP/CotA-like multicopper oxidase with cupredoxin domain
MVHSSMRGFARASLVVGLLGGIGDGAPESTSAATHVRHGPDRISVNDNRLPAGSLRNGVLTIRLEAREGTWYPDRDSDPGVVVRAFGEQGKPLQIPGPLIRVVEGTTIHAIVKNALAGVSLTVYGLEARLGRSAEPNAIQIPPGGEREVRFVAGVPGTYFYRATASDAPAQPAAAGPQGGASLLNGAMVVDPRARTGPARDRVFVVGAWADSIDAPGGRPIVGRIVINGKSWPHTERLAAFTGDTVRWRVINVTGPVHPMHLHGFYFNVTSRGNGRVDSVYAPGTQHLVNTERMGASRTISLTWVPDRPGNWLFHCHDNVHIQRGLPLDGSGSRDDQPHHVENHALEMMGGPVLGISVTSRGRATVARDSGPRRQLRLITRIDSGSTDREPAFGFVLQDGKGALPAGGPLLPGPTIVLRRGEPVSIRVVNELPEPTAIHWHGIELESYFDGVAGFAGTAGRIAPPIAARDSFDARFTPPRAGTFIYHTHIDEVRQQQAGLAGALIVLEPGATHDPETDIPLLVTVPRNRANFGVVLLNGTSTPSPREWRVGTRYRLRFINVHTSRPSMRMAVEGPAGPRTWRAVAKDGMDLPTSERTTRPSTQQMGNGETYDFEFTPAEPGDLRLTVSTGNGLLLVAQPIRVRP